MAVAKDAVGKWAAAEIRAQQILDKMSFVDKVAFVEGGKNMGGHFTLKPFPHYGIPTFRLADATSGLRVGGETDSREYPAHNMPDEFKSTAFPANVAIMATFNPAREAEVAAAIGEACRGKGIHVMLAPSADFSRLPTHGRNFEYVGEDPCLAANMIAMYVKALQAQGVLATMKVASCNNTEFLRKISNSQVSARALREIYLRPYRQAIAAVDVMGVMTAYNLLNGEYCGESKQLITGILRNELGFKGLVMSDWNSVNDYTKFLTSGLDLVMPAYPKPVKTGLKNGTIDFRPYEKNIDRMALNVLTTFIVMGFFDRPQEKPELMKWNDHDLISLKAAREAVILLRNEHQLLPIQREKVTRIVVTGPLAIKTPELGFGSGHVFGWDRVDIRDGLTEVFGADKVAYLRNPDSKQLKEADVVIVCVGYLAGTEGENRDRPFNLPKDQEDLIQRCAATNPNTVVTITAGGSVRMTGWNDKVKAILHTLYLGQKCGRAIAEVLAGAVNPSGKLPFTIEREFTDSYAATSFPQWATTPDNLIYDEPNAEAIKEYNRYLEGTITLVKFIAFNQTQQHQQRKNDVQNKIRQAYPPYYTVDYKEDVFLGYKYYEKNKIPVWFRAVLHPLRLQRPHCAGE